MEGSIEAGEKPSEAPPAKRHKSNFDFAKYHKRYVVLRLFYIGWKYHGFSSQDHEENTVEGHLFRALERTCLLPQNSVWSEIRYSRCGRTDVGVSAASQIVALTLRSKAKVGEPLPGPSKELDYPSIVNRVLPDDIQVTGWAPAEVEFHARFSCKFREYMYFLPGVSREDGSQRLDELL
jgi:tRNA pseudouridine38/39 synthase